MTGTIINCLGIAIGVGWGLKHRQTGDKHFQEAARIALGIAIIWVGLSTAWSGLGGGFKRSSGLLGITLLALSLGNVTGRALRLQKGFNRLGNDARKRFESAVQKGSPQHSFGDGLTTTAILFCATPLGLLGALLEGCAGNPKPLVIKAVMDGLAAAAFVPVFGWGVLAAVVPVLAVQGTLTMGARLATPWLQGEAMLDPLLCVSGLLVFCVALVVFEIKRLEVANYLPSLIYAPLLGSWWLH